MPELATTVPIAIICCGDSDLVAQQVAGTWNARNSVMAAYRDEVDEIAKCFLGYEVKYVRRDDNTAADMLSKLGSGRKPIPPGIFLEHLRVPSVKGANPENPDLAVSPAKEVMAIIPAWTQPFLDYLIDRKLPEDEVHARQIIRRARSYTIVDGQLYKRSANGVFLKCVSSQDGIEILREIHAGDCGHHAAPRSLVAKAFRLGFYWLTAKEDEKLEPVEEEIDEPESSLDEKEEEIDEPESSLDEKEEESDEQKEEEWISYPCQPSNESNSLSLTLFDCPPCLPEEVECYVPVDSLEIVPISKTCENNYATVIYDNPCYFDKSYDNALFVPDVEMHERLFGQYSRNWTKSTPKILFSREAPEHRRGDGEEAQGPQTIRPRGQAPAAPAYEERPGAPLTPPLRLFNPFRPKNTVPLDETPERLRGAAAIAKLQFGDEVSVPAPCRDGEVPRKPSPSTPSPPSCSVSSSPMDYGF
ncbi:hypothetical protein QYE76_002975 [Lolium multiflorum]|uniref:RNase H type-1 domain-containing protein n=1 Tax=Lolium multiflorum TaxID=4521 RepID=A0AAD8RPL3_LOLMU|nr:hypothetical protein QYE76_002975 [Lolium multiflorum]